MFRFVDSMLFGQCLTLTVFRALSKYFSGKDGSAPGQKLARATMQGRTFGRHYKL